MGRFKIKKQDTFIDMTPMSDVMVLLLTFFMLTATFVKDEPVKVNAPGSVSEIKIPETNLLTIFVNNSGKVFLCMDAPETQKAMAQQMIDNGDLKLTPQQLEEFSKVPTFGTPCNVLPAWLAKEANERNSFLTEEKNQSSNQVGIPVPGENEVGINELKLWVAAARQANGKDMGLAIKADKNTPYAVIKKVMDSLRDIDENRYNLITSLKAEE